MSEVVKFLECRTFRLKKPPHIPQGWNDLYSYRDNVISLKWVQSFHVFSETVTYVVFESGEVLLVAMDPHEFHAIITKGIINGN